MLVLYILLAIGLLVLLSRAVYLVLRDMEGRKKQRLNGLLLLFLSIVVFLSMVSYLISGSVNRNLFGPLGHHLSRLLFNAFGISSLVIPLLVFLGGVGLLRNAFNRLFFRIGGYITGLFFVLFITLGYFNLPPVWSGELGSRVGNLIVDGIGLSGGIIVSVFLLGIFTFLFVETGFIRIKRRERPAVSTEKPVRKRPDKKKRVVKKEKKEEKKQKEDKVIEVTEYKERFLSLLSEPVK
ncbi:DNA translocase FtsK 4TM domain-containing protein, partial [candidate division WOR-3 bacterium]|nr:DNA translocase FtsK 4TM domain-containing protein [candidate division WOR-3 bacterium]